MGDAFEALVADLRPYLATDEIAIRARLVNALVEGSAFQIALGDLDTYLDRIVTESERIVLH